MNEQTTTPSQQVALVKKPRALEVMASRLNLEPQKLLETLKATVFKNANSEQLVALVIVANEYQLNPFLKEIYAFPGRDGSITPMVPIDGWTKIVNRQFQFDGVKFLWELEEGSSKPVSCTAVMRIKGRTEPVEVTEYYDECHRNTDPWNKMPKRMLRHKAYMQAARLAFGLSGIQDEDEALDVSVQVAAGRPVATQIPQFSQTDPSPASPPEPAAPAKRGWPKGKPRKPWTAEQMMAAGGLATDQLAPKDDTAAEAAQGLAPAQEAESAPEGQIEAPEPMPEAANAIPEPLPTPLAAPQHELAELVVSDGFTFDQFLTCLKEIGWVKKEEEWVGFDYIPTSTAAALVRSKVGLLNNLRKMFP